MQVWGQDKYIEESMCETDINVKVLMKLCVRMWIGFIWFRT